MSVGLTVEEQIVASNKQDQASVDIQPVKEGIRSCPTVAHGPSPYKLLAQSSFVAYIQGSEKYIPLLFPGGISVHWSALCNAY